MLDKNLLAKFKFFADVSDDKLSAIAQLGNLLDFKAGEIIFRFGDSSDNLYGVVNGEVELILVYRDKLLKADITYGEVPDPTPGRGEVVVRVRTCTLNHLDIWVRRGLPGLKLEMPQSMS
jgi:CRP-like cAMP-binding protein